MSNLTQGERDSLYQVAKLCMGRGNEEEARSIIEEVWPTPKDTEHVLEKIRKEIAAEKVSPPPCGPPATS